MDRRGWRIGDLNLLDAGIGIKDEQRWCFVGETRSVLAVTDLASLVRPEHLRAVRFFGAKDHRHHSPLARRLALVF